MKQVTIALGLALLGCGAPQPKHTGYVSCESVINSYRDIWEREMLGERGTVAAEMNWAQVAERLRRECADWPQPERLCLANARTRWDLNACRPK
jgi:hypothetical protein